MTSRKKLSTSLAALIVAVSPLAALTPAPSASARVAPAAPDGLRLTAPSLFVATAGAWVPVRAKIKNTSSKSARVTLEVTPVKGTQVSAKSISVGKIAPGVVKVAVVRIRAGKGPTSATLKAVAGKLSSETTKVSIVGGFGM